MNNNNNIFKHLSKDIPSGIVVFLVALPLCLGIALASGAPLFAGIIAGCIGGIVVGGISNSQVSVSGPAAGLAAVVFAAIASLGRFDLFLMAVVIAGGIQILLGFIKAGRIADFFPHSVVEGMLAGIGIIIVLKQIPHALGYDKDAEGDLSFFEKGGSNTLESFLNTFDNMLPGAIVISLIGLIILIAWDKISMLKNGKIPGALVVVIVGLIINYFFSQSGSPLTIESTHLVQLPIIESFSSLKDIIVLPDFSSLGNIAVWKIAGTLAIVASIETLLCIEASDKMDPHKRFTDQNRELIAQGVGNMFSGLIGGLPITSVVVRSTANITAGNQTKASTIIHGIVLLLCAIFIPALLNHIPLAALAAILLVIGYKLANPTKIQGFYRKGLVQFVPFIVTLLAVVFTDLLTGVGIGLAISMCFILLVHTKNSYYLDKTKFMDSKEVTITLSDEVSFLHKPAIKQTLASLPSGINLKINASATRYISEEIIQLLNDFCKSAKTERDIDVELIGFKESYAISNLDYVNIDIKK
jgi:MFS superfamily sulfate permease-like transporter